MPVKEHEQNESKLTLVRLNELLEYVHHLGSINQKPMFSVDEYKQLHIWEHQVKGKVAISHNVIDEDGLEAWLKIERLKRNPPPVLEKHIAEWVDLDMDPEHIPLVKEKIIKRMNTDDAHKLLNSGIIEESDIMDPVERNVVNSKDVILRLNKHNEVNEKFKKYLKEQWIPWSEEEKPRRETIKIYDGIFSLQQAIETQVEGQPIELIWGVGIARWDIEGRRIDVPLVEKCVEIELNSSDSSISIRPRQIEPEIAVGAFLALENFGAENLLHFGRKYLSELSEYIEFSPYNRYEPWIAKRW